MLTVLLVILDHYHNTLGNIEMRFVHAILYRWSNTPHHINLYSKSCSFNQVVIQRINCGSDFLNHQDGTFLSFPSTSLSSLMSLNTPTFSWLCSFLILTNSSSSACDTSL